jgi:hypothetical protein
MTASPTPVTPSGLCLTLADGIQWCLLPQDGDAAQVVALVAKTMKLRSGVDGRRLLVSVHPDIESIRFEVNGPGPAFCMLAPPVDQDALTIDAMKLALVIAHDALARGGILLHGALVALPPNAPGAPGGVILAGPGTVGKSTASRRLSPPWRSLCDDATLVVRDGAGQYWAHPWPTWSRYYTYSGVPGPDDRWETQDAVPLRSIFFLSQDPEDRATPVPLPAAIAMLSESVAQVSRAIERDLTPVERQALYTRRLAAIGALAATVPAFSLRLSLTGEFWEEIARAMAALPAPEWVSSAGEPIPHPVAHPGPAVATLADQGALPIVYTGPSMNPTLREPELLLVKPYAGILPRVGDVITFQPPNGGPTVVHRIMRITPEGIQTRGDNNPTPDPYRLTPEDIVGRVIAAQRGRQRRAIAGGLAGVRVGYRARAWRAGHRAVAQLLHRAYREMTRWRIWRRILPPQLRPRLVSFKLHRHTAYKLLMGHRVIGRCDLRNRDWRITRPFRLFVDVGTLPKFVLSSPPTAAAMARTDPD